MKGEFVPQALYRILSGGSDSYRIGLFKIEYKNVMLPWVWLYKNVGKYILKRDGNKNLIRLI